MRALSSSELGLPDDQGLSGDVISFPSTFLGRIPVLIDHEIPDIDGLFATRRKNRLLRAAHLALVDSLDSLPLLTKDGKTAEKKYPSETALHLDGLDAFRTTVFTTMFQGGYKSRVGSAFRFQRWLPDQHVHLQLQDKRRLAEAAEEPIDARVGDELSHLRQPDATYARFSPPGTSIIFANSYNTLQDRLSDVLGHGVQSALPEDPDATVDITRIGRVTNLRHVNLFDEAA